MHETNNELLESVKQIAPIIREQSVSGEANRRLPKTVLETLAGAGFQRMLTPRSLGGLEVDPVTCARVIEEVGKLDSAAGWALQAGNSAAWWCARLPNEGAEEIFAEPSPLIAAAFHPPQRAVQVQGGYRLTGRAPLASNVHDSKWLFLTALMMEGEQPRMINGAPEVIGLFMHTKEVEIIDTWHSLGMKATDSNDVRVNDVFIPSTRSFLLVPEFEAGSHFQNPLYKFPGIGEAALIVAPVPLAIAQNAIQELRDLAARKTAFGFNKPLRDRAIVQSSLARAEGILRSARLLFYDTLTQAWQRTLAGQTNTLEQKADLLLAGTHAVHSAAKVVDIMHRLAGTTGVYASNKLERHFRDAQTLRHHGFASEGRFETAGQVYLNVTPEFAMVNF